MASPWDRTISRMNAFDGLILSRSVHQRNFGRGAGYPRPMRLTQKVSVTAGVSRCGVKGRPCSSAASAITSREWVTHAATTGFSTSVSVLMTCTGLVRWFGLKRASESQTSCSVAVESLPPE